MRVLQYVDVRVESTTLNLSPNLSIPV